MHPHTYSLLKNMMAIATGGSNHLNISTVRKKTIFKFKKTSILTKKSFMCVIFKIVRISTSVFSPLKNYFKGKKCIELFSWT
jgi:hypothetical protein